MSEALREELDELIEYEMADPRVSGITVTEVWVSPDRKKAQVRLSMPPDEEFRKEALAALERAKGFLKREVALRLQMFRIPDLHFEADVAAGITARMDHIMKRVKKGRPRG